MRIFQDINNNNKEHKKEKERKEEKKGRKKRGREFTVSEHNTIMNDSTIDKREHLKSIRNKNKQAAHGLPLS